uniref:Uncharacterized protein n=1 Tax=Nicotiana tabacum TaxID=4097 RepID=A0A1S4CED7_TOBAC|nr:PREDICTED: putative protein TPRXL [Nicotiana tabacum]
MSSSSSPVITSLSSSRIQSSFSPIIHSLSSSGMPSSFSQPARYSSMPSSKSTPFSHGIPSSSYLVPPLSSSPVIPSLSFSGIRSSFSPIIHSPSSSSMLSLFSQPASHSSMPSSESTPSSSPNIFRPHIAIDSNSTSPYTNSDTVTTQKTYIHIRAEYVRRADKAAIDNYISKIGSRQGHIPPNYTQLSTDL